MSVSRSSPDDLTACLDDLREAKQAVQNSSFLLAQARSGKLVLLSGLPPIPVNPTILRDYYIMQFVAGETTAAELAHRLAKIVTLARATIASLKSLQAEDEKGLADQQSTCDKLRSPPTSTSTSTETTTTATATPTEFTIKVDGTTVTDMLKTGKYEESGGTVVNGYYSVPTPFKAGETITVTASANAPLPPGWSITIAAGPTICQSKTETCGPATATFPQGSNASLTINAQLNTTTGYYSASIVAWAVLPS
jgi:hypothetical protein